MSLMPLGLLSQGGGAGGAGGNGITLISTAYGTGSSGTITFSSIPSTYKHLQIRATASKDTAGNIEFGLQFNGDAGSNYTWHRLTGNGSSVSSGWYGGLGGASYVGYATGTGTSNATASNIIDILDYTNTNKNKTIRSLVGYHTSSDNSIRLNSGIWFSTAAISSLSITYGGYNFTSISRFSLYGVN